jgi:hypothetical protein
MKTVVLLELAQLMHRMGGLRGILMLAAIAAAGTLIPIRAGAAFIEPVYLLAYTSFAAILTGHYSAQSWGGQDERAWIDNRGEEAPTDQEMVSGKLLVAALYGTVGWALIFGAALAALNAGRGQLLLPKPVILIGLVLIVWLLANLVAAAVGTLALAVESAKAALQLLRLALLFFILLVLVFSRVAPPALAKLMTTDGFPWLLTICCCLIPGPIWFFYRRLLRKLDERKHGLSILAD